MFESGQIIDGTWEVESALGAGGMALVYRCHNVHAKRILAAIKVLKVQYESGDLSVRFVREAELLFSLDHPNIVKVRNVRLEANPAYIEMEFVDGESMAERLKKGPIPLPQALYLTEQLIGAMRYAHRKGVYHRDLKPGNLVVTQGTMLKVVDFGLAYDATGEQITRGDMAFGTVSYAPPEWIKRGSTDPGNWDIYAVGVILYEMLTGRLAFPIDPTAGPRQQAIQVMSFKQQLEGLELPEAFPPPVRDFVLRITHRNPEQRPTSMKEMLSLLHVVTKAIQTEPVTMIGDLRAFDLPSTGHGNKLGPKQDLFDEDEISEDEADPNTWPGVGGEAVALRPPSAGSGNVHPPALDASTGPIPTAQGPIGSYPSGQVSPPSFDPHEGSRVPTVVLVIAVVAMLVVLTAGLGAGAAWYLLPPTPRDVNVVVTGVNADAEVAVRVGELNPVRVQGFSYTFLGVEGTPRVRWAAGAGCATPDCPGEGCEAWCVQGEVALGELSVVSIPVVEPQAVQVRVEAKAPAEGVLAGVQGVPTQSGVVFTGVPQGRHELMLWTPSCKEGLACARDGTCPRGCRGLSRVLLVSEDTASFELDLSDPNARPPRPIAPRPVTPAPVKVQPQPEPQPVAPEPSPVPKPPSAATSGPVVAGAAFAQWLSSHPEWSQQAAISSGKADSNYLEGFVSSTSQSAVAVSWSAAETFCRTRGGLAQVSAPPTSWTEGPLAPFQEWRIENGQPRWLRYDGAAGAAQPTESNAFTGFRCVE